jgi:hypothetical protein
MGGWKQVIKEISKNIIHNSIIELIKEEAFETFMDLEEPPIYTDIAKLIEQNIVNKEIIPKVNYLITNNHLIYKNLTCLYIAINMMIIFWIIWNYKHIYQMAKNNIVVACIYTLIILLCINPAPELVIQIITLNLENLEYLQLKDTTQENANFIKNQYQYLTNAKKSDLQQLMFARDKYYNLLITVLYIGVLSMIIYGLQWLYLKYIDYTNNVNMILCVLIIFITTMNIMYMLYERTNLKKKETDSHKKT